MSCSRNIRAAGSRTANVSMSIELLPRLGVAIEAGHLQTALTHKSYANENNCESNERLEFLGDSVLGYLVASRVFSQDRSLAEGDLTRLKNSIVSAEALARAATTLEIGKHLRVGKGEEISGGRDKLNILADAMEAVIAAGYLSGGMTTAKEIVELHVFPMLGDPYVLREFSDPKTTLNEKLSRLDLQSPRFEIQSYGPEHLLTFTALCFSGDRLLGRGEGRTIRYAERMAASSALETLRSI
jgi:ribonuclease-3